MWKNCKLFLFLCHLELILSFLCIDILMIKGQDSNTNKQNEDLFKRLFKVRRAEQLEAVKKIRHLQQEKQHTMVKTVAKTIFDVILSSRVVLESSGYIPGVSEFPEKEEVRDALSMILENTALMGDIILRLPDIAEPVLRTTSEWPVLFAWSLTFANQTQLLDNSTATLINLVGQELNITTRSPDYVNPYRKINKVQQKQEQVKEPVKKKKKRTQIPRGPRLSLPQTGEL